MKIETLEHIHRLLKEDFLNCVDDVETIENDMKFKTMYSDEWYELERKRQDAQERRIKSDVALLDFEEHEF